jgi:hypothetical protein
MALTKKQVSLDIIKGADTKTNDQISTNFKDMENVVFTGNLTAKKMNGYDGIYQLPTTDKFSLLIRRKNDLLALSDNGTYKYNSNNSTFSKISEMATSQIQSNEVRGKILAFSTNYYCVYQELYENSQDKSRASFYMKDGSLLNVLDGSISGMTNAQLSLKLTKTISIGDDFYICNASNATGSYLISFNKYRLNTSTNKFEYVSTWGGYDTTLTTLTAIDYFTDGQYVFCIYSDGTTTKIMRWDSLVQATPPTIVTFTQTPRSNVEIFNRDATTLYVSITTFISGFNVQHKLLIVDKSTLLITATNNLLTYTGISNGVNTNWPFVFCYPTSDTTAIALRFYEDVNSYIVGTGLSSRNLSPLSKIFKQGDNYYIGCFFDTFYQTANVVFKINGSTLIPVAICDSSIVESTTSYYPSFWTLQDNCYDGEFNYFIGFNDIGQTTLVKFSKDAKQTSSYIEIDSTNIISSAMPSYFDGESCTEYGFIGVPQITSYTQDTSGSLPADSGYMLMAQYEWKDALGNIFHSQYSQIYSGGNPTSGLNLPASSRIQLVVQCGILTNKKDVKLKIFIKRKTVNTFQKVAEKYIQTDFYGYSHSFTITTYPTSTAEEAVYQDDSVQPMMVTNYHSISLYSDRIFTTTKDFPIAINYSQKKEYGQSFEFNDSTFTVDILDKRGIAEDELTGTIAMDGRLIIFKEKSILYINGSGPSRTNTSSDFSEPQLITTDAGCTEPRSIVLTPDGVMFKSDKGIYLLTRQLSVQYIGAAVEKFNKNKITSAILLEGVNEIRFSTLEGEILVYNYFSNAWSWFKNLPSLGACIWKNQYVLLLTSGQILVETAAHKKIVIGATHTEIIQKISTPWIRLNGEQWWQKVYDFLMLGKYKSEHQIKFTVYYDYEQYPEETRIIDPLSMDQYNILDKPTRSELEKNIIANGVFQVTIDMVKKSCQAFRVEIEDMPLNIEENTGESFEISTIATTVGIKKGPAKLPANKSY